MVRPAHRLAMQPGRLHGWHHPGYAQTFIADRIADAVYNLEIAERTIAIYGKSQECGTLYILLTGICRIPHFIGYKIQHRPFRVASRCGANELGWLKIFPVIEIMLFFFRFRSGNFCA